MKKIAVVTATRAEYGILKPLIARLLMEDSFETQLIVTGSHLSKKFGYTIEEIKKDKFPIYKKIPILEESDTVISVSRTAAKAMCNFASYYEIEKPNMIIVLGDRTELLGICGAALIANIPIAHIHGGELTQGAVDDAVRHAVTKMSYLHFPATELYRKRILQMGEEPDRVFNVGALSTENILNEVLLSKEELCKELKLDSKIPYIVVTYHPVTREQNNSVQEQMKNFLAALETHTEYQFLITKANSDLGGQEINQIFQEFEKIHDHVKVVDSLGMKRYLSAVKHCLFVLGNSSSGVIEAPVLGVPTVNIGDRQNGRIMAKSVVQSDIDTQSILNAISQAERMHIENPDYLFGNGHTSEKIVNIIKKFLLEEKIDLKKKFFDISF